MKRTSSAGKCSASDAALSADGTLIDQGNSGQEVQASGSFVGSGPAGGENARGMSRLKSAMTSRGCSRPVTNSALPPATMNTVSAAPLQVLNSGTSGLRSDCASAASQFARCLTGRSRRRCNHSRVQAISHESPASAAVTARVIEAFMIRTSAQPDDVCNRAV